ncbi:uncharacterized protein [Venturia canescens]|uniref:uncharacterized protein isoform X2 n=1 Tax=Venturia canescens TaxID=32260 RepID=UPI001C9C4319|nr:uncharacterized protein LOC122407807 isoform X2 [Venturia canescens]
MCGNMVSSLKMTPWLMVVFCLVTAGCSNVTDQQTSESQHDQVAILKQIRKVNEDGSYSFGYEAGDGSFKEQVSVVQSIPPRVNRSSTTRKSSLAYASSTESSSTRSSVVQPIPRLRKTTTTASTTTTSTTTDNPRPIFGHYVKSTSKTRPRFVLNGQHRTPVTEEEVSEDSQITRPSGEDRPSGYRRILFAKRPVDHSLRPITEEFEEKEEETKITTGNTLRRQLPEETTKPETTSEAANDDHSDVYGGSLSTTRPLFTTNAPPRLIHRLANPRPKSLYVNQNNLGPARFDNNKFEGPRVYEEESKTTQDERDPPQQIVIRSPQRMTTENREYVRQQQTTEPVYVRQPPEQFLRELSSAGLLIRANNGDEENEYRTRVPIGRILYRPPPSQQPLYSTTTDANVHYLTETPITEPEETPRVPVMQNYMRPRIFQRPLAAYMDQDGHRSPRPLLRPVPQAMDERDYSPAPIAAPEYPYRSGQIALPPEPPNPIAPPLSRRDFQLLLRRLLVSQYGTQALTYPRTYLEDALLDQQPYPSYQPAYQAPLARQSLPYDPNQLAIQYGERVPLRRPGYARVLNPIYQNQPYDDYQEGRFPKRVYRQKFYPQELSDEADEVLPAPIREALLLRMIQLAINADRPAMATMVTSTTPASIYRKNGPVRSVQIITDDEEDDKDSIMKKM